jgi:hypothetical protein
VKARTWTADERLSALISLAEIQDWSAMVDHFLEADQDGSLNTDGSLPTAANLARVGHSMLRVALTPDPWLADDERVLVVVMAGRLLELSARMCAKA